jgi:hypothetical protein
VPSPGSGTFPFPGLYPGGSDPLSDFLVGLAQMLNDADIGNWNASGVYTAGQVGITIQLVPETPDDIIAITAYLVRADSFLNDTTIAIQFRTRGNKDPRVVASTDAAIFDLFEGLEGVVIGGMYLVLMSHQSSLPLPPDANQRWERSSNYYAQVAWPTQHRPD